MKQTQIKLMNIADIREFVNIVSAFDGEVDLLSGRYIVDAKSIMGIFSLDLLSPITVQTDSDNADELFSKLSKFTA